MNYKKESYVKRDRYQAYSLVEMIITIFILAIVMTIVSMVLTSLIKVSAITSARSLSRSESEFVSTVLSRAVNNADTDEYALTQSQVFRLNDRDQISTGSYQSSSDPYVGSSLILLNIQQQNYTCIGMGVNIDADDSTDTTGLIFTQTVSTIGDCFQTGATITPLTSVEVDVKEFNIELIELASGNLDVTFTLALQSKNWKPGEESDYSTRYVRKFFATTERLTL